jgi:tyrosyl-tRNA synthetase
LAEEITVMVHSTEDLKSYKSINIFWKCYWRFEGIRRSHFLEVLMVFLPEISRNEIETGINIVDILNEKTGFFKSNGEARRD